MKIYTFRIRCIFTLSAALSLLACGEGEGGEPALNPQSEQATAAAGGTGAGRGEPGGPCSHDGDCQGGARCLASMLDPDERLCVPRCTEETIERDCKAFMKGFGVDGEDNDWNTSVLTRGPLCLDWFDDSEQAYCGFICPRGSSIAFDKAGNFDGCGCLPGYRAPKGLPDDVFYCEPEPKVQCTAIGAPCTADQVEKKDPCSVGRYVCLHDDKSLEGICIDWVENDEWMKCKGIDPSASSSPCDPSCIDICGANSDCWQACCPSL